MAEIITILIMSVVILAGVVVGLYGLMSLIYLIRRNKSQIRGHEVAQGVLEKAGVDGATVYGGFLTFSFWNYFRRRKALKLQRIIIYNGKSLYAMNSAAEQAYCGSLTDQRRLKRWVIRLNGFAAPIILLAAIIFFVIGAMAGDRATTSERFAMIAGGSGGIIFAILWSMWGQIILYKGIKENLEGVVDDADYKSICFFQKLKIWTAVALLILKIFEIIIKVFENFQKSQNN